jgi:hypothetical protein
LKFASVTKPCSYAHVPHHLKVVLYVTVEGDLSAIVRKCSNSGTKFTRIPKYQNKCIPQNNQAVLPYSVAQPSFLSLLFCEFRVLLSNNPHWLLLFLIFSSEVMFPSVNIQVALQNSNDDNVRIGSDRLEGNADAIQGGHTVVLTESDVLLGRGGKKNQHAGNEKLRLMATKYSSLYRAALKREKPAIALLLVHLVQSMKPSGR